MNATGPERDDVRGESTPGAREGADAETGGSAAAGQRPAGKKSLSARMPWRTRGHRHPEESWWSFGVLVTVAAVVVLAMIAWLVLF